ncbi:phosphoglycerate mutase family protein [Aspergillus bombycis]|uniref:Phosphoglycerate mutase family protein n=1 Tax=Aspergillus bombycis TaxID=109264 RepID=A0A1F7ZMB0_9EURO|nr:phosphoglycerate mutase family protein [Aspergillus bombycis]OGM40607.1 phosphoglycerate mutase family protein [Aspergillus bombycis]
MENANREENPLPTGLLREPPEPVPRDRQHHLQGPRATAYGTLPAANQRGECLLRETLGLHTCDSRSSKTAIAQEYPLYRFEEDFAEEDPLYDPELRESDSARDVRLRELLLDVFAHDASTVVSLTAHSGAITSVLAVVGHRRFALMTGAVIPVLVRAERVEGPTPPVQVEPPTRAPVCPGSRI